MTGTIGPDVARVAVALHRNHPTTPVLSVLDTCMQHRRGSLADFGTEIEPGSPFGNLLAEVFTADVSIQSWSICRDPAAPVDVVVRLRGLWAEMVLANFAARYGLKT